MTPAGRVLVVGGSGGIGRATVQHLREIGYDVASLDRVEGFDACDPDAVDAAVAELLPLEGVVHLAGSALAGSVEEYSLEQWRQILDDNLTSAFLVCRAVIPAFRRQRHGAIVLISSVNAHTGGNRFSGPAYAAAKAAILGFARHLASDLASDGIRVNTVAPGPVDTPMLNKHGSEVRAEVLAKVPLHRAAETSEVAAAIAFLLSDAARTTTGAVLDMNGGLWLA